MALTKIHTARREKYGLIDFMGDISRLIKFRLTALVVVTSLMAYGIVLAGPFDMTLFLLLAFGGFSITSAANILNEMLEKREDALMKRTKNRPIAADKLSVTNAMIMAGVLILIGVLLLTMISLLTALLSMISLVIYAFIYTPLKRYSSISITIGAIPGAMPMLIGCVAAQGSFTVMAIVLFGVQFLWQFPHFLAIAFLGAEDYKNAGFNNVPRKNGEVDRSIGLHATIYSLLLAGLIIIPYFLGYIDMQGVILAFAFSLLYLFTALNFHLKFDRKSALIMMFSSFVYLPIILYVFLQFKSLVI